MAATLLFSAALALPSRAMADLYSYTILNVPGATGSSLWGINNAGQVAGYYKDASGTYGFIETSGAYTTLHAPGAPNGNWAHSINDGGQVVGGYSSISSTGANFVYSGVIYSLLNDPSATGGTWAYGINNSSQIAGYYQVGLVATGFIESGGNYTSLSVVGASNT